MSCIHTFPSFFVESTIHHRVVNIQCLRNRFHTAVQPAGKFDSQGFAIWQYWLVFVGLKDLTPGRDPGTCSRRWSPAGAAAV